MKNILIVLLVLTMLFALTACRGNDTTVPTNNGEETVTDSTAESTTEASKPVSNTKPAETTAPTQNTVLPETTESLVNDNPTQPTQPESTSGNININFDDLIAKK